MMLKTFYLGYWGVLVWLISACSSGSTLLSSQSAQAPPTLEPRPAAESVSSTPQTLPTDGATPLPMLPSPEQSRLLNSLKNQGTAPELLSQVWLNSEPLRLADLRGKVVVVDFWTFG
jgi:hypothetical protein